MAIETAPYTYEGNRRILVPKLLKYDDPARYTWERNTPFEATLEVMSGGATIKVLDVETGNEYTMLPSYLVELVRNVPIMKGLITGTWVVYKVGQSYAVKLIN